MSKVFALREDEKGPIKGYRTMSQGDSWKANKLLSDCDSPLRWYPYYANVPTVSEHREISFVLRQTAFG